MEEKTKKTLTISMGLFIIFVMVFSSLAMWQGSDNKKTYNDYTFMKSELGWKSYINGQYIEFTYGPWELENIAIPSPIITNTEKIYILYNPQENNLNELSFRKLKSVLNYLQIPSFPACTIEENCPDIPIVSCSDEKDSVYIKLANETRVYKEGNCLILEGSEESQLKEIDKLFYIKLGVME